MAGLLTAGLLMVRLPREEALLKEKELVAEEPFQRALEEGERGGAVGELAAWQLKRREAEGHLGKEQAQRAEERLVRRRWESLS